MQLNSSLICYREKRKKMEKQFCFISGYLTSIIFKAKINNFFFSSCAAV